MLETCSDEVTNLKFTTCYQPWIEGANEKYICFTRNLLKMRKQVGWDNHHCMPYSIWAVQTFSTSCYCSEWQLIHMQSTKSSKIVILLVCQTWSTCSSSSYLVQSNNRFPHALPFVRHRGCLRTCDHCSKVCLVPLKKRHLMTQDQRSRGTNFHKDPINVIESNQCQGLQVPLKWLAGILWQK